VHEAAGFPRLSRYAPPVSREHDPDARLDAADAELTRSFDSRLAAAVRRAGPHVTCRRGCTPCCIGVFDITALDARRLRRGLAVLRAERPQMAAGVAARAAAQWAAQREAFPGVPTSAGVLADGDEGRERFFSAFAEVPCPALDPRTGGCLLYAFRPLSCRSYGVPLRYGAEVLPPCPLNFTTATAAEVAAATAEVDPDDREGALLASVMGLCATSGDTTVAAALAIACRRR
jgi:Fe-S-cluster containining protein